MTLPTCCEYHADKLPEDGSCQQGRLCPCHKPTPAPAPADIGYEAGYLPLQFVGPEPEQTKPLVINWQKLAIFCAVLLVILWAIVWPH